LIPTQIFGVQRNIAERCRYDLHPSGLYYRIMFAQSSLHRAANRTELLESIAKSTVEALLAQTTCSIYTTLSSLAKAHTYRNEVMKNLMIAIPCCINEQAWEANQNFTEVTAPASYQQSQHRVRLNVDLIV